MDLLDPTHDADVPVIHGDDLIERLAAKGVAVEVLRELLELRAVERGREASIAFNVAMATAQHKMRPVAADASNPQTRSRYASYSALDRAVRPIYSECGFALSFDTGESPQPDHVRVLCYVTHAAGHERIYHADMPADGKGAKGGDMMSKTHAVGSAMTYGMRYLLKMIFNVAVGEDDDDGNTAGKPLEPQPDKPAGYLEWFTDLVATADLGYAALAKTWGASRKEHKAYLVKTNRKGWEQVKARAQRVSAEKPA